MYRNIMFWCLCSNVVHSGCQGSCCPAWGVGSSYTQGDGATKSQWQFGSIPNTYPHKEKVCHSAYYA
jgi:hypothetical protein